MKKIFEKVRENKEIIATAVGVAAVATVVVSELKAKTKALEIKKDLENNEFSVSFSITPTAALAVGCSIYTVKNGIKVYKMYRK